MFTVGDEGSEDSIRVIYFICNGTHEHMCEGHVMLVEVSNHLVANVFIGCHLVLAGSGMVENSVEFEVVGSKSLDGLMC